MSVFIFACGVVLGWILRTLSKERVEEIQEIVEKKIQTFTDTVIPPPVSFVEPSEHADKIKKAESFDDIYKDIEL